MAQQALDNPEQTQTSERQRGPMDERAASLMCEDRKKGPRDRDGTSEIALRRGKGV